MDNGAQLTGFDQSNRKAQQALLNTNDSTNSDAFIDYSRRQQMQFMTTNEEHHSGVGNMPEGLVPKKKVIEMPTIPAYVRMDSKEGGNQQANGSSGLGLGIVGNKASKNAKDQP